MTIWGRGLHRGDQVKVSHYGRPRSFLHSHHTWEESAGVILFKAGAEGGIGTCLLQVESLKR